MPWSVRQVVYGPALPVNFNRCCSVGAQRGAVARLHAQVRVLGVDEGGVARVDRLRHGDQRQRRLDVAAGLDPAPRDRQRDVLLALEVAVRRLGRHRHADLGLPVHVVGPLPVEVAVLALTGGPDVHDHVEVGELEALGHVGVTQLGPHLGVLVHQPEDAVHDLAELLGGAEFGGHRSGLRLRLGLGLGLRRLGGRRLRRLERGDPVPRGADLVAQRADVVGRRRPQVVERGDHPAGGARELVGELLRALARDSGLPGGRLKRLHRGASDRVGAPGRRRVVLVCHRAPEPIRRALSSDGVAPETIHVHPTAPLADRALLPGDPGRALALAQALCEAPARMFNHNRGLWGYTGTALDGAALTVQSTGIGGPSAAVVLEELCDLGLRCAIRVGTCTALDTGAAPGELVAVGQVLAADGTSRALGAPERLTGDEALSAALAARADRVGTVVSTDLFYDPRGSDRAAWAAAGAAAVDLETAAVLAVARRRGIRAAAILAVVASGGGRLDAEAIADAGLRLGHAALAALAPTPA